MGDRIDVKTKIESIKYYSPEMEGTVIFRFDNNNGVYTIGAGEYSFDTKWSRAGNNSIHAYGRIGYKAGETRFPDFDDLYTYDYSSRSRTIHTGQIIVFENSKHHFAAIKLGAVKSSNHGNPYDEMTFEYHIYSVT